ncbi:MAG: diaminopropionate ammonia-lyase, partial [Spirochaetales bacterium]
TEDGHIEFVDGDLQTIMAGLACGEPNTIGWDILKNHANAFVSCPDDVAECGMKMLAAPVKGDSPIISGESGAVSMGLLATLMKNPDYADLKKELKLDENSTVLMFSTEGDTDRENWEKIVWNR